MGGEREEGGRGIYRRTARKEKDKKEKRYLESGNPICQFRAGCSRNEHSIPPLVPEWGRWAVTVPILPH